LRRHFAKGRTVTNKGEFYGWKLVAVLFALDFLNMGFPFFGGAVINTYMLKEIPMDRGTYGLGFTLLNLFIGLPSIIVAASIVKWGARAAFVIGSALLFLGTLCLSLFASKPWHYLVFYGVIVATGASFSTIVPVTTVVARWFKRYRGRAMAIPLSASGFAGFVGAPLINKILAATGGNWRQAWLVVAGIAIVSGLMAVLLVKERPEDLGQAVDGDTGLAEADSPTIAKERIADYPWTPSEAYRTRTYWMIVIGGMACQFPYFFFAAHWILHLRGAHVDAATAAWAMGVFTMGGIGGRLIGGSLMDKMTARYAFMIGLCCYFAGSVLAIEVHADALSIAFVAGFFYGAGFGWTFVCLNAISAHFYGPRAYPKLNGMALLLTGIACSPAGFIGGKVFDKFGSYTKAFELNIVLAAIGIFALSFATTPRPRNAESMPGQTFS
jgi:MFS family permease